MQNELDGWKSLGLMVVGVVGLYWIAQYAGYWKIFLLMFVGFGVLGCLLGLGMLLGPPEKRPRQRSKMHKD